MLKRLNRFTIHNDLWFHTKAQQFRAPHYSYTMGKMNPVVWLARGCPSTLITNEKVRSLTSSRVMWRSGQLKPSRAVWFYTNWILIGGLTLSANYYQPINVYRVEIENQITRLFFFSVTKGCFNQIPKQYRHCCIMFYWWEIKTNFCSYWLPTLYKI